MSERIDLMATFDARWNELSTRETAPLRPDSTITPRTLRSGPSQRIGPGGDGLGSGLPNPATLPHVSLAFHDDDGGLKLVGPGTLPDLVVSGVLGEGGMGRVHLARQRSLGRDVAVKTLRPEADAHAHSALLSEAFIMGTLEHPGIIPVHVLGTDDSGRPVLVMKRVDGVEWRELLKTREHAAWAALDARFGDRLTANLDIVMELCNAVHFAHSRGVIHRDIKPENVMIGSHGEIYLADFGIAIPEEKASEARELVGTPAYMAPEMVAGASADVRTDVYLLGATLHEVLTGRPRHDGATLYDVLLAALESAPFEYGPDVPQELAELCARATARNRDDRPATALEFRRAVSAYLDHRSSLALSDAAQERLSALRDVLDKNSSENWIAEAHRLSAQARFGFEQALEQWPQNRAATRGHVECLRAMVEIELRREDPIAARAYLDELPREDAELAARTTALEEKAARRRREHERLQIIARELDPSVSSRERLLGAVLLALASIAMSLFALYRKSAEGRITHALTVTLAAFLLVGILSIVFLLRRHLLRNTFNRRFTGLVVLFIVFLLVHRSLAWVQNMPVEQMFVTDLLLGATVMGVGALTVLRWMAWIAATFFVGALTAIAYPEYAGLCFSAFALVATLLAAVFWQRTT